jgi:hypothetical protein
MDTLELLFSCLLCTSHVNLQGEGFEMTINNAVLFNAALNGYLSGAMVGSNLTDPTATDYAGIVNQAKNWATELDSLIATDTTGAPQPAGSIGISAAGGASLPTATSTAVYESQLQKTGMIQMLSMGIAFQRYATGQLAASFAIQAAAVKAAYFQGVGAAATP